VRYVQVSARSQNRTRDGKEVVGGEEREREDTYDLDKTLAGFRVTFCLVRESVSSITPRGEGPRAGVVAGGR